MDAESLVELKNDIIRYVTNYINSDEDFDLKELVDYMYYFNMACYNSNKSDFYYIDGSNMDDYIEIVIMEKEKISRNEWIFTIICRMRFDKMRKD